MADLKITNLIALAEAAIQATDPLAIADVSATETKKVTVKDLIAKGVTVIDDGDIPAAKVGTLGTNQVASGAIQDGAVTAAKIASGTITATQIANTTITGGKLVNDTVTATQIAANAITASELADDAVDTGAILDLAVTDAKIANTTISYGKLNLAAGSIPGAKIATGEITATQLAADSVSASELANNAVDTAAIVDGAVEAAKIATNTITANQIAADAIGSSELADDAVDTNAILDDAVTTGKILNANVTASKLAANLPGTILATGAISSTQLATNSVTAVELADNAVDSGAIANNAVIEAKIAADAVTNAKIKDGEITPAKLNTSNLDRSLNVASGNLGINNAITAGTRSGITFNAQGLITGTVALAAADLPVATSSAVGGISAGTGLSVNGSGVLSLSNSVTGATVSGITFSNTGQITAATALTAGDIPTATTSAKGAVQITSGGGLTVDGSGNLSTSTSGISAGTYQSITVNNKGVATAGAALTAALIPDLAASKITSGTLDAGRIGADSIDGTKLSNTSTAVFQSIAQAGYPTAQFNGQILFDTVSEDAFIWDGNAWQAITTLTKGSLVFGGNFNASTSKMTACTTAGLAAGLAVGSNLPTPSATTDGLYVVVDTAGTPSAPAPVVAFSPPDYILGVTNTTGSSWNEIDLSQTVAGQVASNITFTPYGQLSSTNVQDALQELETEKMGFVGGTLTGQLLIGNTGSLVFEGSTIDAFETTITVADPTSSDKTITFPDTTGTVITTGDTNTVNKDMVDGSLINTNIAAGAAIAFSKLAALTSAQILVGNGSNVVTGVAVTGDISINNAGLTAIAAGVIVNADVSSTAAIAGSKITTGTTSAVGVLQLTDSATSTSATTAATPAAVKIAKDAADAAATTANAALPKAGGTMTGNLILDNAKELRLSEGDSDGANYTGLKAQAQTGDITLTLPAVAPTAGQVLKANASTPTTLEWGSDTATDGTKMPLAGGTFTGDVTFTGDSSNGLWDKSASAFVANLTGNASGSSGSCTGNAATATALATARTINGTSFDGTAAILVPKLLPSSGQSGTAIEIIDSGVNAHVTIDLDGGEKFRFTSDGNLLVGATGTTGTGDVANQLVLKAAGNGGMTILGGNTHDGHIFFADTDSSLQGGISYNHDGDYFYFRAAGDTERFRINSSGVTVTGTATATAFSGPLTGNVTGNASTATALATARTINAISFDGSADIRVPTLLPTGTQTGTSVELIDTGSNAHLKISLDGAEKFRFWPDGLGIGTDTISTGIPAGANNLVMKGSHDVGLSIIAGDDDLCRIVFTDEDRNLAGSIDYNNDGDSLSFATDASERMRLDSSGRLIVGHTAAPYNDSDPLQVVTTSDGTGIIVDQYSASSWGGSLSFLKSRSASVGNTILQDNDKIGTLNFYGNDGAGRALGAQIDVRVDGTPGSDDMPSRIVFLTAPDGSQTPSERMRIDSSGKVGIGTAPSSIFHIKSSNPDVYLENTGGGTGQLRVGHFTNGAFIGTYNDDGGASDILRLGTHSGDERLRIASNGAVGIGGNNYGTSGQVFTSGGSGAAPSWADAAGGGSEVSATATGAITADKSVCVKSDGTFEQIATSVTINNPATAGSTTYQMHDSMPYDSYPQLAAEPDDGFVALSICAETNNQGHYKLGKINSTTGAIDWYRSSWTNTWYNTTTTYYTRVTYGKNSAGENIFLFSCINNGNQVVFRAAKVESSAVNENGTLPYNLTFGNAATYTGTGDHYEVQFNDADDKFYIVCGSAGGSISGSNDKQVMASIAVSSASGFACTIGSDIGGTISGSGGNSIKTVIDPSTNNIFSFIQKSNIVKMIPWTWGGSAYTMGSMVDVVSSIYSSSYKSFDVGFDSKNSKIILCYAHSDEDGRVMIGDVSGASVTWGSHVEYQNANTNGVAIAFDSGSDRVFIGARNEGASDNAYIYNGITSGSGASSTITFTGSNATVSADTTNYYAAVYEPSSGLVVFGYGQDDDNDRGKMITFNLATVTTNATDENFIGFAKDTVSNGASSTVKVVGNTTTQSGLTPGQKYYLQIDGTISLTPAGGSTGLASTVAGIALSSTSLLIKG